MKRRYLLDASALLAAIFNEPGADRVWEILDDCAIHAVNLAEVARKMVSLGMPATEVRNRLHELALETIEQFSADDAFAAGSLGAEAKRLGLSLGDCVCLVSAQARGLAPVTADRRWSELMDGGDIVQIR